MTCPVCTVETTESHSDEQCIEALLESGLFLTAPWFTRTVPPMEKWTDRERQFAHDLALQAVQWKQAELNTRRTRKTKK